MTAGEDAMPETENGMWSRLVELVADVPWGILAFVGIILAMLFHWLTPEGVADAKALLPAAGLLGIGHGIHQGTKHLRPR